MTDFDLQIPTPLDLMDAPEVACLTVLDACLRTAERALLAVYPELCDLDDDDVSDRTRLKLYVADAIIHHMQGLTTLLDRYRRAVEIAAWRIKSPFRDDDIPF